MGFGLTKMLVQRLLSLREGKERIQGHAYFK